MSPANSLNTIDHAGAEALMHETNLFIEQLAIDMDIAVHQTIDQFFYMEKTEELRVLNERINELRTRLIVLQQQRDTCYTQVKQRLTLDTNWLHEYRKQH